MKSQKILIVEDDFASRVIMEKLLQSDSYETVSCGSGEHAVKKLKEEFFGILISDFQMWGMDGLELIREARKIHPGISTILVTGVATEEIELRAKGDGVNGFFPKPIEWDELVNFLDALKGQEKGEVGLGCTRFGTDQYQETIENDSKGERPMGLIVAENITKNYHLGEVTVRALKDVSFSIEKGAFVSFVGPSGSGKTTLLNLIGCLDKPSGGRLLVAGMDVSGLGKTDAAVFRGAHIGFIFQSFNLIPILTAYENVEYPLIVVQNIPAPRRRKQVEELLSAVGMSDQRDKRPDQLSGGQKQRVAIARALVTHPNLVLADEPTANLDHDTAMSILRLMKKIRDELETTFVFSTHDTRIIGEAEVIFQIEDGVLKTNGNNGGRDNG